MRARGAAAGDVHHSSTLESASRGPAQACRRFANGAVIELTVAEEELLELLLKTPKVTVPWARLEHELAGPTKRFDT